MKADPSVQLELLELQDLDLKADQLRHQRSALPELAQITELSTHRRGLDDQARDHRVIVDDLTVEQNKIDADIEQVKTRRDRDQGRIAAGQVTDPKALERLNQELESINRRITSLEDDELEIMESLEQAQGVLDALSGQIAGDDEQIAALSATRDQKFAEIDAQVADITAARGPFAEAIPADLLALYEKLRSAKGGVGAAAIHQRRCTGCQLTIDSAELNQIKAAPADDVLRCEECSRILIRTAESGL